MNYHWKFEIPKETEEDLPYVKTKKVTYGTITKVTINNPAGSVGKSHLRIFYHEWQLYPISKGEWYEGEKINVSFEDYQPLYTAPFELKFKGWNESLSYTHAFHINMVILREAYREREGEIPRFVGMEGEV